MHQVGIRDEIAERVVRRRGRLHLFDSLDPGRTALLVIDMQNTFCEPKAPAEVPGSRGIVEPINRLAAGLRTLGGRVIWITHANTPIPGGGSDWRGFFEHFVSEDVRERTIESLSPGSPGQSIWHELYVANGDLKMHKNRYSAMISGSSPLERTLRSLDMDTVLIAGTKTNVCCESTARDAMMLDFKVVMISDATAALSDEEHRATLETVIQQFGDVMSTGEALACLAKHSAGNKQPAAGF
jgi:ureidoacrylate peracid hydrolase